MKCAFMKKECNKECAAFEADENVRDSEYVWDTCLNEYIPKFTTVKKGNYCKRLGYLIGKEELVYELREG